MTVRRDGVPTLGLVDFHSHMVPGVDDGSETLEQSLAALQNMWDQGITHIITTPHLSASTLNNPVQFKIRIGEIDEAWKTLENAAGEAVPGLTLKRGVELALDEPVREAMDDRIRLAATRFALVEFPWFTIPPYSARVLAQLAGLGVTPIVAHPERYENVDRSLTVLSKWKQSGAFLQVNAGSLAGAYGERIESRCWGVIERGLGDYLSSDYHARGKCLTELAKDRLEARKGDSQFRMMTAINGQRLLAGMNPSPVDALPRKARGWRKIRKVLRGSG